MRLESETSGRSRPRRNTTTDGNKFDEFGLRAGSIRSKAAKLYARESGATLQEVKAVVGSIQYNVLTSLINRGFSVQRTEIITDGKRKSTRFRLLPKLP